MVPRCEELIVSGSAISFFKRFIEKSLLTRPHCPSGRLRDELRQQRDLRIGGIQRVPKGRGGRSRGVKKRVTFFGRRRRAPQAAAREPSRSLCIARSQDVRPPASRQFATGRSRGRLGENVWSTNAREQQIKAATSRRKQSRGNSCRLFPSRILIFINFVYISSHLGVPCFLNQFFFFRHLIRSLICIVLKSAFLHADYLFYREL